MRHVPSGGGWHPTNDDLAGTHAYGSRCDDSKPWSVAWHNDAFDEYLFASGNCKNWLISAKSTFDKASWTGTGGNCHDRKDGGPGFVLKSSISKSPYNTTWCLRKNNKDPNQPWVSLREHERCCCGYPSGKPGTLETCSEMLYGENSVNVYTQGLRVNDGADVYIRVKGAPKMLCRIINS